MDNFIKARNVIVAAILFLSGYIWSDSQWRNWQTQQQQNEMNLLLEIKKLNDQIEAQHKIKTPLESGVENIRL